MRAVPTPRQPLRIVVDRHGADAAVGAQCSTAATRSIVTAGERNPRGRPASRCWRCRTPTGRVDLAALMRELGARGINELHVEAGGKLNGALLAAGLVDEILLYLAPCLLGDPARGHRRVARRPFAHSPTRARSTLHDVARVGDDLRIVARVVVRAERR